MKRPQVVGMLRINETLTLILCSIAWLPEIAGVPWGAMLVSTMLNCEFLSYPGIAPMLPKIYLNLKKFKGLASAILQDLVHFICMWSTLLS